MEPGSTTTTPDPISSRTRDVRIESRWRCSFRKYELLRPTLVCESAAFRAAVSFSVPLWDVASRVLRWPADARGLPRLRLPDAQSIAEIARAAAPSEDDRDL